MAYELGPNQGSAFKVENKTEDWHADYKGKLNVNGKAHWLDVTIKQTKAGEKFLALKVRPLTQAKDDSDAPPKRTPRRDLDDEIPFDR